MKRLVQVLSLLALAMTLFPAVLVLAGRMTWTHHSRWMAAGMVLWFATAPFWMRKGRGGEE